MNEKPQGKYEVSALVDIRLTVYTNTKEDALVVGTKIIRNVVSRFGAGSRDNQIIEIKAIRKGSGEDFVPRAKAKRDD